MGKEKDSVSSGSGSAHGASMIVDYDEAIRELLTKRPEPPADWGGSATVLELAEIIGKSQAVARTLLRRLRANSKIRSIKLVRPAGGYETTYSKKDIFEAMKAKGVVGA